MRFLAILLSAYILLLSCYPCQDSGETHQHTKKEQLAHAHSDCHGHDDGEVCSPLCACGCCTIHCISANYFLSFPPLNTTVWHSRNSSYKTPFVPLLVRAIWQPPKL